MKKIQSLQYEIVFGEEAYEHLIAWVEERQYSQIFILVDSNTGEYCLPRFLSMFPFSVEVIEIPAGEPEKTIETCIQVWKALSDLEADRQSLLINLGGGVVTDLGGFVGATYMRGLDFINLPTSLLAMVDASVGGKTGVDLEHIKNQIGVIMPPQMVLIDVAYLNTLPTEELKSGLAEMFKHGLIADAPYWEKLTNLADFSFSDLADLIFDSVSIKNNIVRQDPTEKGLRKTLNFGHTLGHAIESYCLNHPERRRLLHGEAIAIGMVLATYFSVEVLGFDQKKCDAIKGIFASYFEKQAFSLEEVKQICQLLKHDKKNRAGQVNFVLLKDIGQVALDCKIDNELINKAFVYYQS